MKEEYQSLKRKIFDVIDDKGEGGKPENIFDFFIIAIILLNVGVIFLETYPSINAKYSEVFGIIEYITIAVFTVEYAIRIWTCTFYPQFSHPVYGRIRYAFSLSMIIDFLAVFPFFLEFLLLLNPRITNFLQLLRLFRVLKLLRYYGSIDIIYQALKKNRQYLFSILIIFIVFLIFSSYLIYSIESEIQPDKLHDFDDAFWWAIVTISTVGYGDVYPVSNVGKFFTVIIMLIGIGLVALPTGIIASAFLDEMKSSPECRVSHDENSIAEEIQKLKILRDEGVISEEEFCLGKEKLLR